MSEYDELKLYFGYDYILNDRITIHNPTLRDIVETGEETYLSQISIITATPSDFIAPLYDLGIDWESVSDYDFFASILYRWIDPKMANLLFPSFNIRTLHPYFNKNGETYLQSDNGAMIDANIYRIMTNVVRKMHGLKRNIRKAANKYTKEVMIETDRADRATAVKDGFKSSLLDIVSALINSSGFKYGLKEVLDMPYMAFIDSVDRISAIKRADTLAIGGVCGMADLSKVPRSEWNWLRTLGSDKKKINNMASF